MKKSKILNALLILSSLLGFLEWGGNNNQFLFEAEAEILSKLINNPSSIIHPFILLPLLSQLFLLSTLFQKEPNKLITLLSIGGLGLLLAFMFIIGLITLNIKILISTLPFLIIAFITIKFHRKNKLKQLHEESVNKEI